MKASTTALLVLLTIAACERPRDEVGREVDAADSILTSEHRVDTTIIARDTNVEVDTIRRPGDRPVRRDTIQRRGGSPNQQTLDSTRRGDTLRP